MTIPRTSEPNGLKILLMTFLKTLTMKMARLVLQRRTKMIDPMTVALEVEDVVPEEFAAVRIVVKGAEEGDEGILEAGTVATTTVQCR